MRVTYSVFAVPVYVCNDTSSSLCTHAQVLGQYTLIADTCASDSSIYIQVIVSVICMIIMTIMTMKS